MNLFIGLTGSYGIAHFIAIALCIAIIVLGATIGNKWTLKTWYKILLYTGITSETIKVVSYILANESLFGGYLPKTDLPFQLCSIQLIFIAILNFSNNDKLKRLLMGFMIPTCMIGGIAAILIPTSSSTSMLPIYIQYFGYHAIISAYAIKLLRTKEMNWNIKDYKNTLLLLCFIALVCVYLNSICTDVVGYDIVDGVKKAIYGYNLKDNVLVPIYTPRVNFMYLVEPPASGLPFLNKNYGWAPYICHYGFVAFVAISLCYIKPIINSFKKKTEEVE